MWGWAGVEGLHGQALLYATLRKPLWVLGPHFKCLFILALITRSNPTADTVVCVCKGLECKAEVPLWKPVSLTKHYFLACPIGPSEAPQQSCWSPTGCTRSWFMQALIWQYCQTWLQLCISESFFCCWLLQGVIISLVWYATMAQLFERLQASARGEKIIKIEVDWDGDFFWWQLYAANQISDSRLCRTLSQ